MKKRNPIHLLLTIAAVLVLVGLAVYSIFGGRTKRDIIGVWVCDSAGVASGFQCATDGMAASVHNSATQYNNWEISRRNLILHGKRFANRRVFDISDTLTIKKISSKSLTAERNGETKTYRKIR